MSIRRTFASISRTDGSSFARTKEVSGSSCTPSDVTRWRKPRLRCDETLPSGQIATTVPRRTSCNVRKISLTTVSIVLAMPTFSVPNLRDVGDTNHSA